MRKNFNGIFQATEMDGWVEWAGHFLSEGYQLTQKGEQKKDGTAFIWHPHTLDNMAGGSSRRKDSIRQQMDDRRINNGTCRGNYDPIIAVEEIEVTSLEAGWRRDGEK